MSMPSVSKSWRRYFRTTREGLFFIVVTGCVGLAAINTGNNLLFLIFGFMISLIVLVGLACKNAILIVEFAREKQLQEGMNRVDAVLEACRLRLRPILMTSIATIAAAVPLSRIVGCPFHEANV